MKVSIIPLLASLLLTAFQAQAQNATTVSQSSIRKVVIDAGHGGKDPGTVHGKTYEKDINLSVALKLGDMIREDYPDVEVIYTRSKDVFVELYERGDIANRANADLFISIHVDASKNTSAHGATTYIMGLDKSDRNMDVAMRENDVVSLEDDYTTKYEGYVPGSAESFIMFSLMQYANQDQSTLFSQMVQKRYAADTPMSDRGARQAPYLVLWRTAMPSVLTEMGFMSNASDRTFLTSADGQRKMARALADAFGEYKNRREAVSSGSHVQTAETSPAIVSATPAEGGKVEYFVQLMLSNDRLSDNDSRLRSYRGKAVQRQAPTGRYRVLVGPVGGFEQARELQAEVRKEFKDAFIVAYHEGEVISNDRARELEGR